MTGRSADLPAWIFDVEDTDAIDMQNKSLLEELELDPQHISRMAKWALIAPLYRVFGKRILERHPLRISKADGKSLFFILVFFFFHIFWLISLCNLHDFSSWAGGCSGRHFVG